MPPKSLSPRKSPARRTRAKAPELARGPIVNADEKRELIRAHVAMRAPHDPVQIMSIWAGVAATFIVVAGAWWWASKPGLIGAFTQSPTKGLEAMVQDAATLRQSVSGKSAVKTQDLMTQLETAADRLNALEAQARANQGTVDRVAAIVSTASAATVTSSASGRTDLFVPKSQTTSTKP